MGATKEVSKRLLTSPNRNCKDVEQSISLRSSSFKGCAATAKMLKKVKVNLDLCQTAQADSTETLQILEGLQIMPVNKVWLLEAIILVQIREEATDPMVS